MASALPEVKLLTYTVGIDTGGTFTDCIVMDNETGRTTKSKVLTTPFDLTVCFKEALEAQAEKLHVSIAEFLTACEGIRYSQTISTNTIVTRSGTKIGLIVTSGYESEVYGSGPEVRTFVDPELIKGIEVSGKSIGTYGVELDLTKTRATMDYLVDHGARAIVVALKGSFNSPAGELAVRDFVRREYPPQYLGRVPVFLSHEVARVNDDRVRTCTTVVGVYVHRSMRAHLYKAEDFLNANSHRHPLLLVKSDGTLSTIPWASAAGSIGSGPAAGVLGARLIGKQLYGLQEVITMDLGGTSLDYALVGDGNLLAYYAELEGITVFQPMVRLSSAPVGGGSLVRAGDGRIQVGPESAGSTPGPACFGRGGIVPTPTDANLILGYLDPSNFLGGRIQLSPEKAEAVIRKEIADPLGLNVVEASWAIRGAAEQRMVDAMLSLSLENKKDLSVFCYGGGGPLHICSIMNSIAQLGSAYVFPFSSEFSAMGCNMLDISHSYSSEITPNKEALEKTRVELTDRASMDITGEGLDVRRGTFESSLYNQNMLVKIPDVLSGPRDSIGQMPGPFVYSLMWRAESRKPVFNKSTIPASTDSKSALKGSRKIWWKSGPENTRIFDLNKLEFGHVVNGPAVIESEDSTIVLENSYLLKVDEFGNFKIGRTE